MAQRTKRPRVDRGEANREALMVAARDLFADQGPAAVSIRTVAEHAGCSHTLVGRHFGSKAGLEAAVVERLAVGLSVLTTRQCSSDHWPMAVLLEVLRFHPQAGKVLVRCALGEFDDTPLVQGHTIGACLADRLEQRRGSAQPAPSPQAQVAAYAALALILGVVGFEPFLLAATHGDERARDERDAFMAGAAEAVASLVTDERLDLEFGHRTPSPTEAPDLSAIDSRSALIEATIELYSAKGQAALTTREIAERAQVNQGLIYHYFESREHLLSEALAAANQELAGAATLGERLDVALTTQARVRSRFIPMTARLLVNGVDITTVRHEFPVFERLLTEAREHGGARDPRLAAMAAGALAMGATLWDDLLRRMVGLPADADLVKPLAAITAFLLHRAD